MDQRAMLNYIANSKSGVIAALLNLLLPGLGYLYCGYVITAIVVGTSFAMLVVNTASIINGNEWILLAYPYLPDLIMTGIAASYLIFFITGFGAAQRHNQQIARELVSAA